MYVFKVDSMVSISMLALAERLAQEHPRWGMSFLAAPCYTLYSFFATIALVPLFTSGLSYLNMLQEMTLK